MARLLDVLLDEHTVVAERRLRLLLRQVVSRNGFLVVPRNTHSLATTSSRSLDHHRVANLVRNLQHLLVRVDLTIVTRNRVHLRSHSQLLRADLVSHSLNGVLARSTPDDSLLLQRLSETPVLRQETVTRMNGVRSRLTTSLHNLISTQVRLSRRRRSNVHSLVSHLHVLRVAISIRIHGHRLDSHALGSLEHTASNLSTVSNQDLLERELR